MAVSSKPRKPTAGAGRRAGGLARRTPMAESRSGAGAVQRRARELEAARLDRAPVAQAPAGAVPGDLGTAYRVQTALVGLRLRAGERRSGVKVGFTSRAKALQMGVAEPIYGRLTDGMLIDDGGVLDPGRFIQPRLEPEIAVLLKTPLEGRVSPLEAFAAVAAVAPAIEIVDSRYRDFIFALTDVVADNCSAAGYVVGPWHRPDDVDLANLGLVLESNGAAVAIASSAAVLGHPLRALALAARLAASVGERLEPGSVVLTGSATAAVPLTPGTAYRLCVERLGQVGFSSGA